MSAVGQQCLCWNFSPICKVYVQFLGLNQKTKHSWHFENQRAPFISKKKIRKSRTWLYSTKVEEKCAWGQTAFVLLPLYSLHHCLNGRLPWRLRGPSPYWSHGWSQRDGESRKQMLPDLILLSPISSVSTFTFAGHRRCPPLPQPPPQLPLWFLSSGSNNNLLHRF